MDLDVHSHSYLAVGDQTMSRMSAEAPVECSETIFELGDAMNMGYGQHKRVSPNTSDRYEI